MKRQVSVQSFCNRSASHSQVALSSDSDTKLASLVAASASIRTPTHRPTLTLRWKAEPWWRHETCRLIIKARGLDLLLVCFGMSSAALEEHGAARRHKQSEFANSRNTAGAPSKLQHLGIARQVRAVMTRRRLLAIVIVKELICQAIRVI